MGTDPGLLGHRPRSAWAQTQVNLGTESQTQVHLGTARSTQAQTQVYLGTDPGLLGHSQVHLGTDPGLLGHRTRSARAQTQVCPGIDPGLLWHRVTDPGLFGHRPGNLALCRATQPTILSIINVHINYLASILCWLVTTPLNRKVLLPILLSVKQLTDLQCSYMHLGKHITKLGTIALR